MLDIAEEIQQLSPEQRKLFFKKLQEGINEFMKKFEEKIKKEAESPYVIFEGMKIKKNLRQLIPYTEEAWKEEMEKQKRYKDGKKGNKELANFIDKFFFEGGRSLHLEKRTTRV